jgi:PST family polysaccharide transporter
VLELAWVAMNVGLTAACLPRWGLQGAGIAFAGAYVGHALLLWPVVRRLTGFRWSRENVAGALGVGSVVVGVFVAQYLLPPGVAVLTGVAALAGVSSHTAWAVLHLLPAEQLPARLRRLRRLGEARR